MEKLFGRLCLTALVQACIVFSVFGSEAKSEKQETEKSSAFHPEPYSANRDIAFISVMGSRPDTKKLQGFQRAILFNARGEVVQKVDISNDSIVSLDRMIQENKSRGPLFIRMYR